MVVQASNHIKTAAHARGGVPKCPCDNVSRWAMEPADKITGISIGAASCVNSIKITFDIDGTTRVTPRYGGPGGELFQACLSDLHPSMHLFFCLPLPPINTCYQIYKSLNFTLMQDEYLTSVSGYVKHDCSKFPCVSQLTFTTNLGKKYGPYGGGGGTFFEVNVEYDEIKGFFGHATEEYLTAFGVYIGSQVRFKGLWSIIIIVIIDFFVSMVLSGQNLNFFTVIRLFLCIKPYLSIFFLMCYYVFVYIIINEYMLWLYGLAQSSLILLLDLSPNIDCIKLCLIKNLYGVVNKFQSDDEDCLIAKGFVSSGIWHLLLEIQSIYVLTNRWIVSTLQEGLLSQHHVDSKYSEMLGSCISKEAFDVVIFYVYFEKGSTPTSIWTMCPSKIGAKHELRYARKVRKMCLTYPETEVRYSSCMRYID
ncbi:unnamed protein product [Musa hybrid cultivar]